MKEETKKMGFFTKVKTAIFKLEEYDKFLAQKFREALKYFILIVILLTAIFSVVYTYEYSKQLNTAVNYIKEELPDFTFEDNILKFSQNVEAYDEEYRTRLIINTDDEIPSENLNDYERKMSNDELGLIILKDKFTVLIHDTKANYKYSELENFLNDVDIKDKQSLVNGINYIGMFPILFAIFIEVFIVYVINNLLELFIYVLMVAIFGYIATGFARVRFPLKTLVILAIYSVTLPNILYETYIILNLLTGFYIKYFSIFYMLICCVYIFTAIFMIKSDLIRQHQEIQAITKVQKEIQEELEENVEENSKEKEKTDDKEDKSNVDENPIIDENKEPDGSEI